MDQKIPFAKAMIIYSIIALLMTVLEALTCPSPRSHGPLSLFLTLFTAYMLWWRYEDRLVHRLLKLQKLELPPLPINEIDRLHEALRPR